MKTLIIAMGILSLFTSCSGGKERLAKKEDSAINEFEVEKSKSYLDADTLGNIVTKGDDTIEVCTKMFDITAFEQHKKDNENITYIGYEEILPNDTLMVCFKDKTPDHVQYIIIKHPKNSYFHKKRE